MDGIGSVPLLHFVQGLAEVVQPRLVQKLDFTSRVADRHKSGNVVDDHAEALLIRAESLLRTLAVVDVGQQHVPTNMTSLSVGCRQSASMEPVIDTVGTSLTRLNNIGLARIEGTLPRLDDARKVIGMHHVVGGPVLQLFNRFSVVIQHLTVDELDLEGSIQSAHKARNTVEG